MLAFGGGGADGSRYVIGELLAGGSGASAAKRRRRRHRDRRDELHEPARRGARARGADPRAPRRAARDSGRRRRSRGGLGIVREYEILDGEVRFTHRGERHYIAPKGRRAGATAPWRAPTSIAPTAREEIPSKLRDDAAQGDRVVIETAGGGGYGAAELRDPQSLSADLADGKIGPEGAKLYTDGQRPSDRG